MATFAGAVILGKMVFIISGCGIAEKLCESSAITMARSAFEVSCSTHMASIGVFKVFAVFGLIG